MKRILAILILSLCTAAMTFAQTLTFSGTVLEKGSGKPVEFATIVLEGSEQWGLADAKGNFTIRNVQAGKHVVNVSCLGYVGETREVTFTKDVLSFRIYLCEDNLTLESVVVTAQEASNSTTTTRTIDRTALDHIQMLNVTGISSLLPGGATVNDNLTSAQMFSIRSTSTEAGNPTFGTAVEVDGVRLSNNASFEMTNSGKVNGATTNNIASSNVESVEVITGVPSVEYGDMTSGVVKINTKKGKTPYMVSMSTNPNTKQASLSKGFGLGESAKGRSRGVLNSSVEYARSISDRMSPYTAYTRKQISLTYSNTLFQGTPLRLSVGVTGNLGGLDSSADPDAMKDTFTKTKDNAIRGNLSLNWLLSKSWITNIEFNASASYSDKLSRVNKDYMAASSLAVLHGKEKGYFVATPYDIDPNAAVNLIGSGYWNNVMAMDNKPMNFKIALKANWARQWGKINNKVKLGGDWTSDKNFGIGEYSEDQAFAPSYRTWRYCDMPFMNNLAGYLEDNLTIPVGKSRLTLVAGARYEQAFIRGSAYDNTSCISPRFSGKWTIFSPRDRRGKTVKELNVRAGWGISTKLPSYAILYPEPTYSDILTFASTSAADGTAFYAYYIMPRIVEPNPGLRWQRSRQAEAGLDIDIAGNRISLSGFYGKTLDIFKVMTEYKDFSYKFTGSEQIAGCPIPVGDRQFAVDQSTGIVTVSDKTGAIDPITLGYTEKNTFKTRRYAANGGYPVTRYGLEWVIDFKKIKSINTTIRLDGKYYGYRHLDTDISYTLPSMNSVDGTPYKYIGVYCGPASQQSNGSQTRTLNTNVTVTTNIPKVRMVISLKVESSLVRYSRNLSQHADGSTRTYLISDKNDMLSIVEGADVHKTEGFTATFPDYYFSFADGTLRPYLKDLKDARERNRDLYNDLSKLATVNSYTYTFKKDNISPYFCANLSVTKEIGDIASISFYANNFFCNQSQVKSSKTGMKSSVAGYIPGFYYGLSLRLKF